MALQSMTGFARAAGQDERMSWTWEARSVNGRSLDVRVRVPSGFEAVEQAVRAAAASQFHRGNVSLSLTIDRSGAPPSYRLNRALLDQVLALQEDLTGHIRTEPPSLEGLLAVRGMLETVDEVDDELAATARQKSLSASGIEAIASLAVARAEEGARLEALIANHIETITGLTEDAHAADATQPQAHRERLRQSMAELLQAEPSLPEERLVQEVALLVGKSDVREELDRLKAHIAAAHDLMAEGAAVGRRFDFLCQELNRESNTVCSKSSDVALTRIGLALKAAIEQLREQIQNVE
ncbi:MAG: YicC family protein [Alphaproteobacteria bacterium]|nr:YicC family protein [Alphaproteobacteria bacterium]